MSCRIVGSTSRSTTNPLAAWAGIANDRVSSTESSRARMVLIQAVHRPPAKRRDRSAEQLGRPGTQQGVECVEGTCPRRLDPARVAVERPGAFQRDVAVERAVQQPYGVSL